ncbi:hypothetical protein [Mesorhizobium sp.]|uniref:hypothetical protein n=1 Tax=Mesorhizobium sp. TaxID=1871066 RepID=UPI0025BDFC95|nr:hypothetical protein [Mesorhizobium sp.]
MTATGVSQHSSMHKTKASRAVAALEQRRWLKRWPDEADRQTGHLKLNGIGGRLSRAGFDGSSDIFLQRSARATRTCRTWRAVRTSPALAPRNSSRECGLWPKPRVSRHIAR